MGNEGCVLLKGCNEADHRAFEVKLFQNPNGVRDNKEDYPIRNVLSSFYWGEGGAQGIPYCKLCAENCDSCTGMAKVAAFDASSKGYDKGAGMYTRVHRDPAVVNAMRAWVGLGEIDAGVYAEPRSMMV